MLQCKYYYKFYDRSSYEVQFMERQFTAIRAEQVKNPENSEPVINECN
jgi:hypothetical protein